MLLHCLGLSRIRHVKCDEERPACHECRRTGRPCDGYASNGSKALTDIPSLLYGKIFGLSSAAIAEFHMKFLESGEERRYYEYFQCKTRQQINDAFGSSTRVHQLILQASHSNISIKHTVIALGSLTEHLDGVKFRSHDLNQGMRCLSYADTQYIKGIRQLQKDMTAFSKPSPELVLVSCLLLSLFDFLRGEEAAARVHLAAGIDILRRCFAPELQILTESLTTQLHRLSLLVMDFARIFSVMDLHASIWLGRPSFSSAPMIHPEINTVPFQIGTNPSLDDVSTSLNFQIMHSHAFHHENAPSYDSLEAPHMLFHIFTEKERLLSELQQWPSLLLRSLSTLPPLTGDQSDRVALMRMNYHSIFVTVSSFFNQPSTSCHESFEGHISQIVANAYLILGRKTSISSHDRLLHAVALNCQEPDPNNIPMLAFVTGAIQPLYLAATKCQDPQTCQEAIALLEKNPWREGAWDSATMARLARKELEGRSESDRA